MMNVDIDVVEDFGREWERFDQGNLSDTERQHMFDGYFAPFPFEKLSPQAVGFDAGCGTGRWAVLVAPRVGHLHCVDPSSALEVARRNLAPFTNCTFHRATVDEMPFPDASMDFGYSLGVLHHIPDTQAAMAACVRKLKIGAPFLVYLYYALDNRPSWFRALWRASDAPRRVISRLPDGLKYVVTQAIAAFLYFPLARGAGVLERLGASVDGIPLSAYRTRSFYSMRTDALDRFGTRLEHRFTRKQIQSMMEEAGLTEIKFSDRVPFWCAAGVRR